MREERAKKIHAEKARLGAGGGGGGGGRGDEVTREARGVRLRRRVGEDPTVVQWSQRFGCYHSVLVENQAW